MGYSLSTHTTHFEEQVQDELNHAVAFQDFYLLLCVMIEPTAADLPSQNSWGFGKSLGKSDIAVLCQKHSGGGSVPSSLLIHQQKPQY